MNVTRHRARLGLFLLALALAACNSGTKAATDTPATTATTDVSAETKAEPTTADDVSELASPQAAAAELPTFISDFDRVCTTQVGFGGAAPYDDASPGLHPMVLFESFGADGTLLESSREFPAGWAVEQDSNFEDNSELAAVQLVVCSVRVGGTPNGTKCEFDSDGETLTLELVDATYEVTVHRAATGEEVGAFTLDAASTECPYVVSVEPGDTQHFNEPTDDDLIVALRPFVEV